MRNKIMKTEITVRKIIGGKKVFRIKKEAK
jgi:hypothetical protein